MVVAGAIYGGSQIVEDAFFHYKNTNPGKGVKPCRSMTSKRAVLSGTDLTGLSPLTCLLKELAGRANLVDETINPALRVGSLLLCETWSTSSRFEITEKFPKEDWEKYFALERESCLGVEPDLVIFFDVDIDKAYKELAKRNHQPSGGKKYLEKVREFFIGDIEENYPDKFRILPAFGSQDDINKGFEHLLLEL